MFLRRVLFPIANFDLWWHLAAGRSMIQTGTILRTDQFSHTMFGAPWIDFEWLAQVLLFKIYDSAGVAGLRLFRIVMATLSMGLLVRLLRAGGARGFWLLAMTCAGFELLLPRFLVRPELTTLVFFPSVLILILDWRSAKAAHRPWLTAILLLITVLWVNLHAGFLYGIAAFGLLLAGDLWADGRRAPPREQLIGLGLMGLATLLNPFGWRIYEIFWEHAVQFKGGSNLLQEWRPPVISTSPLFWVVYFIAAVALIAGLLRKLPPVRRWAPLVVIFLAVAGSASRNTALTAFVALPFLAVAVPMLVPKTSFLGHRPTVTGALAASLLVLLGLHRTALALPETSVQWHRLPVGAVSFVSNQKLEGPLFNSYHYGGYIEFFLGPDRKVFMDGRYLFYPLLKEVAAIGRISSFKDQKTAWETFWSRYKIQTAVVWLDELSPSAGTSAYSYPLARGDAMFPAKTWALVYWDDQAAVFVRRRKELSRWIGSHEYRYLKPYNPDEAAYRVSRDKGRSRVEKERRRHEQEVPFSAGRGVLLSLLNG